MTHYAHQCIGYHPEDLGKLVRVLEEATESESTIILNELT
jgi:hypothetical protein